MPLKCTALTDEEEEEEELPPEQEFLALSDRIAKTYAGFNSSGQPGHLGSCWLVGLPPAQPSVRLLLCACCS